MPAIPMDLISIRDTLQELLDEALISAMHAKRERQHSERLYIAALSDAWRILDREVARLEKEE
jgi:hypothetical protein